MSRALECVSLMHAGCDGTVLERKPGVYTTEQLAGGPPCECHCHRSEGGHDAHRNTRRR